MDVLFRSSGCVARFRFGKEFKHAICVYILCSTSHCPDCWLMIGSKKRYPSDPKAISGGWIHNLLIGPAMFVLSENTSPSWVIFNAEGRRECVMSNVHVECSCGSNVDRIWIECVCVDHFRNPPQKTSPPSGIGTFGFGSLCISFHYGCEIICRPKSSTGLFV